MCLAACLCVCTCLCTPALIYISMAYRIKSLLSKYVCAYLSVHEREREGKRERERHKEGGGVYVCVCTLSPNGVVIKVTVVQVHLHSADCCSSPKSRRYYEFSPSHFVRNLNRPIVFAYYF